jgi:hypothetical protein
MSGSKYKLDNVEFVTYLHAAREDVFANALKRYQRAREAVEQAQLLLSNARFDAEQAIHDLRVLKAERDREEAQPLPGIVVEGEFERE